MPLSRAVPVTLMAAERKTLKKRARGAKTAYRDRLRAQIVLAAARGRDNARIAADLQFINQRPHQLPPYPHRNGRRQQPRAAAQPSSCLVKHSLHTSCTHPR